MGKLEDAIVAFLGEHEMAYSEHSPGTLRTTINWNHRSHRLYLDIREKEETVVLFLLLGEHVPDANRLQFAEYIARANYGLKIGCFEMDMDDGDLRYRVGIDVEGGALTSTMVGNMMSAACSTMGRYFPGFMHILYGAKSAQEAVSIVEAPEVETMTQN